MGLLPQVVSIHAPTRGATQWHVMGIIMQTVSIHAPTRGATLFARAPLCAICVSIHAPTRGATVTGGDSWFKGLFQSTPPRGGRQNNLDALSEPRAFQSTPPRGGRHHHENDYHQISLVSIHAPTRGATPGLGRCSGVCASFNPRPHAGGDLGATSGIIDYSRFNPRPHAGGDSALFG